MTKEKKIKFTYFLNKRLKPLHVGEEAQFRVYVRISYNRFNTQFLFFVFDHGYLSDDQFDEYFVKKSNPAINEQINEFEEAVTKVIRFEAKKSGDKYTISGISDRLFHYYQNMSRELEKHIQKQLFDFSTTLLPGEDLRAIFHDAMMLEDSYTLIEKKISVIRKKLPVNLVDRLTAYYQFRGFIRTYHKEIRCLDWLDLQTQISFKEFLFTPHPLKDLFPNEAKHSPFLRLFQEFEPVVEKAPTYLKSMDKMLMEIIC